MSTAAQQACKHLIVTLLLCLILSGCIKAPVKAYHFMYCDKMNADKIHCDKWATPNGKLHP